MIEYINYICELHYYCDMTYRRTKITAQMLHFINIPLGVCHKGSLLKQEFLQNQNFNYIVYATKVVERLIVRVGVFVRIWLERYLVSCGCCLLLDNSRMVLGCLGKF